MAINVRREENPLLVKNSHIAPQNQEDYKMAKILIMTMYL